MPIVRINSVIVGQGIFGCEFNTGSVKYQNDSFKIFD